MCKVPKKYGIESGDSLSISSDPFTLGYLVLGIIANIANNKEKKQPNANVNNGYFITTLSRFATVTENTIEDTVIMMFAFASAINPSLI